MRAVDTWVDTDLNPRIRPAFQVLGARAHFVDLYAMMLDNMPLEVLPIFGGLGRVGLFGLDSLHPTIVGYGLIVQAVCDTIAATEGLAPIVINLQACYEAETLLQHLPSQIALADLVLSFIGAFVGGSARTVGV